MSESEARAAPEKDEGSERQRTSDSWVMVDEPGEKPQEKPQEDQPAEEVVEDKPQDQDKPAEPEEEPTKPEEPPSEEPPEETPAEETQPEPEDEPSEPADAPAEPEEKPEETAAAEPEEKPEETAAAEPEETPVEPEEKPTESEDTPAEPEEQSTEPQEEKPAEPEEKPAETEKQTEEPAEQPAKSEQEATEPEAPPKEEPAEEQPPSEDKPDEKKPDETTVEVIVDVGKKEDEHEPGEETKFGEYLRLLQVGSDLKKVKKSKVLPRIFRLEEDLLGISWNSQKKSAARARIPIASISEVREGRNTASFKASTVQVEENLSFSIIYTFNGNYRILDLATSTVAERDVWVKGLTTLLAEEGAGVDHSTKVRNRWLQDLFNEADVNGDQTLSMKEVTALMHKLNVHISKKVLKQKFKAVDADGNFDGKLNFDEFCSLFSELAARPELKRLFNLYSSKLEWLTVHDLQKFLQLEQGAANPSLEQCHELIQNYEPTSSGKSQGMMSLDGFTQFMLSPESDIFNVDHSRTYQDMTQPLSHYFIASSHNTYLLEDQLKGPSSCEAYVRALRKGCRCVELDCWDGPDDEPVIYHGHTLTSKIAFKDAIQAIKDNAFEKSSYPVILSIENHCSIPQQHKMAEYMEAIFGDMLFKQERDETREHLPSPEELKFKILIKGKKLAKELEDLNNDDGEVSDEDEAADIDPSEISKVAPPQQEEAKSEETAKAKEDAGEAAKKEEDKPAASEEAEKKEEDKPAATSEEAPKKEEEKPAEGEKKGDESTDGAEGEQKTDETKALEPPKRRRTLSFRRKARPVEQPSRPHKKIKLSSKLSKCINYVQSVHFKGMDVLDGKVYHMSSFGESSAFKYTGQLPVRFTQYNRRQLSRIYPGGSRVTSTNYDPVPMWNAGCQIVALNYQTPCKAMDFNDGKFLQNGGCGYVLKPEIMREELSRFDHTQRLHHIGGVTPKILTIKMISGQHLPKPGERKKGEVIDPYVVIQLAGVGDDCKQVTTKAVKDNGFNPHWDETFEFVVRFPELALLRFKVMDKDWGPNKDDFIASFSLPFDSIVAGYRHIHLTKAGQKLENDATLFVHVHIQDYIAPSKLHAKSKTHLSLKKNRDYPEHHLIGHQPIDLHFRNCGTALHRGVDLKEDFLYAKLHFKELCGHGPQAELSECVQLLAVRAQGFKLQLNTVGKDQSQVYKLVVATEEGQTAILPSALQTILDAFNHLNQAIQPLLEQGDIVLKDLETIYKEAEAQKAGLIEHLNQTGSNSKRIEQVMDHYCRTMFSLKSEAAQLRKVKESAADVLKELNMACQKAGIEVNSSI